MAREVSEETGLRIVGDPRLAYVLQIDNRRPEQLHGSRGAGSGYLATVWTFEAEWTGDLQAADPEGFVVEARLVPIDDALGKLEDVPWHSHTVRYLRGELEPGVVHLERWHPDGRIESVATLTA